MSIRRWSKGESLEMLKRNRLNTPIFSVFKKPFSREAMISSIHDFPGNISIRTWKENKLECPFYPNHMPYTIPDILDTLLIEDPQRQLDEIIMSQGIDPAQSERCGRISHLDDTSGEEFAYLSYFEGPGTVRDLDKKIEEDRIEITIPRWGWVSKELWQVYLMSKCRPFFYRYPRTTLEWSIYPMPVGRQPDTLIFWEVL